MQELGDPRRHNNQALNADLQMLYVLLAVKNDKTGQTGPEVQMSERWVASRADGERVGSATSSLKNFSADRRVVLVTFESSGSPEHGQALLDILRGKPEAEVQHGVTRDWGVPAIDAVVAMRVAEPSRLKGH